MIVESNAERDRKSAPLPSTGQDPGASGPPPEYSQSREGLHQQYLHDPHIPLRVGMAGSARWRFFKAFCIAVAIWVLFGVVTRGIVEVASHGKHKTGDHGMDRYPLPSDEEVVSCLDGGDWASDPEHPPREVPGSSDLLVTKTFGFPVDANLLYLLNRGSMSYGALNVSVTDVNSKAVTVEVAARYSSDDVIEKAKVCLLKRSDANRGLGIFTPERQKDDWPPHNARLSWALKVSIPVNAHISAFTTDMSIFVHHLNLEGLNLNNLTLRTSNAPVQLENVRATHVEVRDSNSPIRGSVNAERIELHTSNSPIRGEYSANTSLVLKTSNSPIMAKTEIRNRGQELPTKLELQTSNGHIESEVTLVADTDSKLGGGFDVVAETSNAPLRLIFADSPVDHVLRLRAHTSIGPADVSLHRAFEGSFSARTSYSQAKLLETDVEDPKGRGRQRKVDSVTWDKYHRDVSGKVSWGEREAELGSVEVETSLAPVSLTL